VGGCKKGSAKRHTCTESEMKSAVQIPGNSMIIVVAKKSSSVEEDASTNGKLEKNFSENHTHIMYSTFRVFMQVLSSEDSEVYRIG